MNNKEYIIFQLQNNSETFISGEDLAKALNISRAAISKIIKEIKNEGIVIESVPNKGYKLSNTNDLISRDIIKNSLQKNGFNLDVYFHKIVNSTNLEAKRLILNSSIPNPSLIIANEQSQGKGRFGKIFFSPKNSGIYFSIIENSFTNLKNSTFITICTALAITRAIEKLTGFSTQIKWVNDIFFNGKKICGILTEAITNFETGEIEKLIIGIGINFSTIDFPKELESAGSLFSPLSLNSNKITRNDLIINIVTELDLFFKNFNSLNYREIIEEYKSKSNILGKEVLVTLPNTPPFSAIAVDIDEFGHLIIKKESNEILSLNYGEVSIKKI
ncbi:MAG: biotin--[acetyl-CoA-carboxylase] ligase [Fusobacteriaceae bacterium]|nr:biotin--[acetyl-CoA-carboxylase] ligase [Fusobacteriaceae bacterium]